MEDENEYKPTNEDKSQPINLADHIKVGPDRNTFMLNKIDLEKDKRFAEVVNEIVNNLPENPDVEAISREILEHNFGVLGSLSDDLEQASGELSKNKAEIARKIMEDKKTPLVGEWFDSQKPANVCQQNVILLSAVAALYGHEVRLSPFTFTGKTSEQERTHVVGRYTKDGQEYVADPTPMHASYGDLANLPLDQYLEKFDKPDLLNGVVLFSTHSPLN